MTFRPFPLRCYLTLRELPDHLRPAHVYREGTATVLVNDPRVSRMDLAIANLTLLTPPELAIYRAAYDAVLGSERERLTLVTDQPALLYVPPGLRLPGEANLQGGQELLRRHQAGELQQAIDLVLAERREQIA